MSRRRGRAAKPTGKYKSGLEARVASKLGVGWRYEQYKFHYTVDHTYNPDFTRGDIVIEAKGFFRSGDPKKYKAIAKQLAREGKRYIFVWSNPHKPIRKGTKLTNAGWCEKNGIEWMAIDDLGGLR